MWCGKFHTSNLRTDKRKGMENEEEEDDDNNNKYVATWYRTGVNQKVPTNLN